MASIFERNGTFQISFYDGSRSPKQKQRSLGVTDERKAKRLHLDLEDAYEDGLYDPWHEPVEAFLSESGGSEPTPKYLTGRKAMRRFLDAKAAAGRKPKTLDDYERVIDLFLRRASLEEKPVAQIRPAAIRSFIYQDHLAAATRRNYFRHLRAWLNWLESEGYLSRNPKDQVETPKTGRKLPKALKEDELKALCEAADTWMERIIRFAVYSGMRPSEIGRLRWSDVDFDQGLIHIKEQKNHNEDRIALTDSARKLLEAMPTREGLIFNREGREGERWVEYVSKRFRDLRRSCELREELTMYSTRHTHATWAVNRGVPLAHVSRQMRHSSVRVTEKYLHVSNQKLKDAMSAAF